MSEQPLVGVVMGSKSDYEVLSAAVEILRLLEIPHEARVVSAHRTPDRLFEYAETARARGLRVIIAGAGGAAHLPGMLAAKTLVPVLGVPVAATQLNGLDSLLSIVQMPKGVPVGTLAIGKPGAANAALLAAEILATTDSALYETAGGMARGAHPGSARAEAGSGAAGVSGSPKTRKGEAPSIVLPGGLVAILGGGQLGRMTAMAARTMGYRVRVMDPEPRCPASFVVDETIVGRWDDVAAARRLATGADVVTLEIEQIGVDALAEVARIAPLRPGVEPIRIIQDKTLQKTWLADAGFPVGPFRVVRSEAELHEAVAVLGGRVFLKIGRGGYDGRGQARIGMEGTATEESIAAAWQSLGARAAVAEQALDLDCEISVMAARNPSGEVRSYPAARNHHENQILAWSVLPAGVPAELELRAEALAAAIIASLGLKDCFAWRSSSPAPASCW